MSGYWSNLFLAILGRTATSSEHVQRDEALIVSLLSSGEEFSMYDIRYKMKDHTRGEHDWSYRSEKPLYRTLDAMVADGIVNEATNKYRGRIYSLAAPASKLVRVK